MTVLRYEKDAAGIVHLILDAPGESTNRLNLAFRADLAECTQRLNQESDFQGVVLRSAKDTFCVGGDLDELDKLGPAQAESFFQTIEQMKTRLRNIESLGKPVVACINGTALGGGWQLALVCHRRICLDDPKIKLGLPEVGLGLMPGAGGVVRMTRLLGLEKALPYLMEGRLFTPQEGIQHQLIHELADSSESLLQKAKDWIMAHPESCQVWDRADYRIPGGGPHSRTLAPKLSAAPAMLIKKTQGCYPAPKAILAAMVEGALINMDAALRIESRYLTQLVCGGPVAQNMIASFWHQLNHIKKGASRPAGVETERMNQVGILGAGMMGAGIACVCAQRGLKVVLKDLSMELSEKGRLHTDRQLAKMIDRGKLTQAGRDEIMKRIQATDTYEDLGGCDLIIEAVFEDREIKAEVTRQAEAMLNQRALIASNTSTLPITSLAQVTKRPQNFVGLHFFSPVEKMKLVEIIRGRTTSDKTLARAYDFVLQIGKTPIVVNDSRGFFTSRLFGAYTLEGMAMLAEGVDPVMIENLAVQAGFPIGPLAVSDEVTLTLLKKVRDQTIKDLDAAGQAYPAHPADSVVDWMLEQHRPSKAAGAGFYDYPNAGKKRLWPGLRQHYPLRQETLPPEDIRDRLMFVQAIEAVCCLDEGVLQRIEDANIGSVLGIGYPAWTGGVLQFINQFGLDHFVERADSLAKRYAARFTPPLSLRERAADQRAFVAQEG